MESAMAAFCSTRRMVTPWRLMVWTVSKICSTSTGASPIEGARHLGAALLEPRENGEDAIDVFPHGRIRAREGAHLEVLQHTQAIEDAPPFRDVGDAASHN